MKVKPVEGRVVRDPHSLAILTEEREVADHDPFWLRRVRDGDVERVDEPQPHRRAVPRGEA